MRQFPRAIFIFFMVFSLSTQAQDTHEATNAAPRTTLTTAQWSAVEGYYQSTTNKNLYVQASAHDGLLLMKFMWFKDRDPDTLRPLSDLVFTPNTRGGEKSPGITFVRDSNGAAGGPATSVNYAGYTWRRVKEPTAIKEMRHTPDQLARFAGIYHSQRDSNNIIQFVVEGNDLILKETEDTHLVPESELSFYKPDNLWFSVDFSQDPAGNITQALVIRRDIWIRNPKPHLTAADLHSLEGKYRAKNDSDNIIQLIAHGNQLMVRQLWDGKTTVVTPLADLYFYNREQSYALQFVRDSDGKIRQAWLFNTTEFDRKVEN